MSIVSPAFLVAIFLFLGRQDVTRVCVLVLMGSDALDETGPESNLDVVRATERTELTGTGSFFKIGHVVVVSDMISIPNTCSRGDGRVRGLSHACTIRVSTRAHEPVAVK